MNAPTLRPYQFNAGTALEEAFFDHHQNRVLIKKPTGTGKTVWFAALLQAFPRLKAWLESFPEKEQRMLVIAHREELLDQAAEKIRAANPGLTVSVEQGDRIASVYSDVIVASIQTLSAMKFRRLRRLTARMKFRVVVVDEAHHAAASTYRTALVHLGFLPAADASDKEDDIEAVTHDDVKVMEESLRGWDGIAPKDRLLIGVTATPNRSDAIGLGCVFQTLAFSYALKQAIADGWLVPIVPWVIETASTLDAVRTTAGEFNQKDLAVAVNNEQRNELAVAAWYDNGQRRSTLAFTVDVQHAHDLAEAFRAAGVRAAAISGETPKDERRATLAAYTRGEVEVITNCMVLTEGTDLPRTGCILHAKPTKSATLYEQMTGRGLRLFPDKPDCIVIDLVDIARRHSLQTAPALYGLPPGLLAKGKTLEQLEKEIQEFQDKYPGAKMDGRFTLEQLRAKASTFDIWNIPSLGELEKSVTMDWLKMADDRYRISFPWEDGIETVSIEPDVLGRFDVVGTVRPKEGAPRQRTIAAGIPAVQIAIQMAEAYIMQDRRSVSKLTNRNEPWKLKPVSDGQRKMFGYYGIPYRPGMLSGEASRLIDLAKARRGK